MSLSDSTTTPRTLDTWHANASAWIDTVRGCSVPGRQDGKDQAVLNAIALRRPQTLMDVGCGEGWLVRHARTALGCEAVGVDGAPALIDSARAVDPGGEYAVADYDDLCAGRWPQPCSEKSFDAVVFNFALFEEDVVPLLSAAASRLSDRGVLIVQTLSVETLPADRGPAREGWRTETFEAFGTPGWTPMRWFCRHTETWLAQIRAAGLNVAQAATVRGPDAPLSLVIVARRPTDVMPLPA